jgi:hypothetical protein
MIFQIDRRLKMEIVIIRKSCMTNVFELQEKAFATFSLGDNVADSRYHILIFFSPTTRSSK